MTRLFIYGTLKRGCSNHFYLTGQRFLGEATTAPGFRLFGFRGYPGMVSATDGRSIEGELWEVDDACREKLDVLEGVGIGEYALEPIPLLPPHEADHVLGYVYKQSVAGRPDIGTRWIEPGA